MFEVVINPAGAGGAAMQAWKTAERCFQKNHIAYHVTYSTIEHDMDDITHQLTKDCSDVDLVIVGGDGSMNRALNGIVDLEHVRMGLIPCGSGNDLAKALQLQMDAGQCAEQIIQQKVVRTLDVGKLTYFNACHFEDGSADTEEPFSRRFIISSGIGFDAAICEKAERSKFKKFLNKLHLGKLIYILVAIGIIFASKKSEAEIILDSRQTIKKRILSVVCMNTCYEGGGFKFCPKAVPDDDSLDVCVCGDLSKFDFFRMFPTAYSGSHVKFKEIHTDQIKHLEIKTKDPMWLHTDGEVECMSTHVAMELCEGKLKILN